MDISVVICTYNRCDSLRRTLRSFCKVRIPENLHWELLVVDNNSRDSTAEVCSEFKPELPLRYVFERTQGKSHALNHSIQAAEGDLMLFTDDDVEVDSKWLESYQDVARRHPGAVFFGGKVTVGWEEAPPAWLAENQSWLLPVVQVDRGSAERALQSGEHPFFLGANWACRKKAFEKNVRFPEEIGPAGSDASQSGNVRGEEIELQGRLLRAGCQGIYVPQALIRHCHLPHRMTEGYLRRWYRGHGIAEVRSGQIPRSHCWFGAPRYFWKLFLVSGITFFLSRWTAPARVWLKAETDFAFACGVILECRRQRKPLATK